MASRSNSNELKLTRVLDAPLAAVWDAWTDSEKAAHWWGPRGFTITTHSKDFRPGGSWVYTMHGPDGKDWPNTTHYLEIKHHELMVYDHGGTETTPPLFRVTVRFKESEGKTTMDMTMALPTPEAAENTRKFIKKVGGDSTWDRFAEYLDSEVSGKKVFVINRSFDVPVERMFEMWTNPEHLSRWLPPTGQEMEVLRGEIREGSGAFFRMFGNGIEFYGRTQYREIQKPNRIVYTQQFCTADGQSAHHPFAPTWPETMLTTVTLTAEATDRTRVTVNWEPAGDVSCEELQTFVKARTGMTMGWTGSFDKLEAILEPSSVSA